VATSSRGHQWHYWTKLTEVCNSRKVNPWVNMFITGEWLPTRDPSNDVQIFYSHGSPGRNGMNKCNTTMSCNIRFSGVNLCQIFALELFRLCRVLTDNNIKWSKKPWFHLVSCFTGFPGFFRFLMWTETYFCSRKERKP